MATLSVQPPVLTLFFEIVRDAWRDRHAAALDRRTRLVSKRDEIAERRHRLVDAFAHDRKIDQASYDDERARLDETTAAVDRQIADAVPEDLNVEAVIAFARDLLANPAGWWQRLDPERRPTFQQAVYANGLTYSDDRDDAFGTASVLGFHVLVGTRGRELVWRP